MSWANIAKKPTTNVPVIKNTTEIKIIENNEIRLENYESLEYITIQENLYNSLEELKENCETFTPWLLNKVSTSDLLNFLNYYIEYKETIIYSSESEEEEFVSFE
uniref:Uncharacterized protein n=1 Tax=viral metagenome TaxID=1070528 RepID=A0A6C0IVA9_9ZZZZ